MQTRSEEVRCEAPSLNNGRANKRWQRHSWKGSFSKSKRQEWLRALRRCLIRPQQSWIAAFTSGNFCEGSHKQYNHQGKMCPFLEIQFGSCLCFMSWGQHNQWSHADIWQLHVLLRSGPSTHMGTRARIAMGAHSCGVNRGDYRFATRRCTAWSFA